MKTIIRFIASLFIFWLLLFFINRLIFLAVQYNLLRNLSAGEIFTSFQYAFPLDVSAACYSCVLPFLLILLAYGTGKRIWLRICRYVVLVFIFLQCAIAYGEAGLYTQWQSKLNYEALAHFAHPSEVFKTTSVGLILLFFGFTILFGILFFLLYKRLIHPPANPPLSKWSLVPRRLLASLAILAVGGFILLTGMRGGWKRFPISESIAYYSSHSVLNDAAVNPSWGLMNNFKEHSKLKNGNPYKVFPEKTARSIVDSLFYTPKDTTVSVLTIPRPNIVFFILESWSADAVQNPESQKITPVFDSLIQDGIYFDNCYATGFVSDQGIPGNLSAFPACYGFSICNNPEKSVSVPAINEVLQKEAGYTTGFIYGGQLDYGNIRSYIFNKKYGLVRDEMEFSSSMFRGALGIPDGVLADSVANMLNHAKQPFFYSWYTLSSHMPYDIPTTPVIHIGSKEDAFLSSMHYSDSAIGRLLQKIKQFPWYKNTLFVFASDHSHDAQYVRPAQHKDRHRIPLLLYGDVIRPEWKGKTMHHIVSQLDIAGSLLAQLHLPRQQFPWSKNFFNPYTPQFAAYNYWYGAGIITPEGFVGFDNRFPEFKITNVRDTTLLKLLLRNAHALQQQAYDYFLKW